jgi:hypothetical protein
VLTTVGYMLEAGYYAALGWTQALNPALFASGTDVPMLLLQKALVVWLFLLGGLLIGTAWYRNTGLGALMIPVGLLAVAFSGISVSGEPGPFGWIKGLLPIEPGLGWALATHLVLYALFIGLSWIMVRDVPIRNKTGAAT